MNKIQQNITKQPISVDNEKTNAMRNKKKEKIFITKSQLDKILLQYLTKQDYLMYSQQDFNNFVPIKKSKSCCIL
jgi:hypothetical protein